jgi:hypothetical protein
MGGNVFKVTRAFVIAVVIAISLLGSASIASANTLPGKPTNGVPPVPARLFDVTWE